MVEPGSLSLASTAATSISAVSPGETVSASLLGSLTLGVAGSSVVRSTGSSSCGATAADSGVAKCAGAGVPWDWETSSVVAAGTSSVTDCMASGAAAGSGADADSGAAAGAGATGNTGAAGSGAANTAELSVIAVATGSAK